MTGKEQQVDHLYRKDDLFKKKNYAKGESFDIIQKQMIAIVLSGLLNSLLNFSNTLSSNHPVSSFYVKLTVHFFDQLSQ